MGMTLDAAERIMLYTTLRDCVSAAIRLDLLGPIGGAKLTAFYSPLLTQGARAEGAASPEHMHEGPFGDAWPPGAFQDAWEADVPQVRWPALHGDMASKQCDPVLDILQGQHDTLYSRLFLS
eukprot:scaffold245_cov256-Pinguiococcus_pyrenoidosus.AAC.9